MQDLSSVEDRIARAMTFHDRWQRTWVEEAGWCPFAAASRRAGRSTARAGWEAPGPAAPLERWGGLAEALDGLVGDPAAEVLQWVVPRVVATPQAWEQEGRRLLAEWEAGAGRGRLAMAAFHPGWRVRVESPGGLIPLLRRSPWPMWQFVRLDALARVRQGREVRDRYVQPGSPEFMALLSSPPRPGLAETILQANWDDVMQRGRQATEAALEALAAEARAWGTREGVAWVPWDGAP
jgi:hypothetical protein